MSKKEKSQRGAVSETQKIVTNALDKIKDQEKEHKAELDMLQIEHANEVPVNEDNKCFLIQIGSNNIAGFKKIHPLLTKKFEEQLSSPVIIIPSTAIFSPALHTTISPLFISSRVTFFSTFSFFIIAVFGVIFTNF